MCVRLYLNVWVVKVSHLNMANLIRKPFPKYAERSINPRFNKGVTDSLVAGELKFYREDESGDYLAIDPSTNQYYLDNLHEDCFEARATAIANDASSVCTTSISRAFLQCEATEVSRSQVPAEWLAMFE